MTKLITLLLILQIFCVSLSANTHITSVNNDHYDAVHHHFELADKDDINSHIFKSELEAHDSSKHSHFSLDIVILSRDHFFAAYKSSWATNFYTLYIGQTLSPPVPPPDS